MKTKLKQHTIKMPDLSEHKSYTSELELKVYAYYFESINGDTLYIFESNFCQTIFFHFALWIQLSISSPSPSVSPCFLAFFLAGLAFGVPEREAGEGGGIIRLSLEAAAAKNSGVPGAGVALTWGCTFPAAVLEARILTAEIVH
jgi:hypothetical protein